MNVYIYVDSQRFELCSPPCKGGVLPIKLNAHCSTDIVAETDPFYDVGSEKVSVGRKISRRSMVDLLY